MENGALVLRLKGDYEFEEVMTSITAALADPCFRTGAALLIDERGSTVSPTAEAKRTRVEWIASLRPLIGSRVALLTTTDPSRYGVARMASVFFETAGLDAAVFTEGEAAAGWLGSFPSVP
jgi:hypothetical protein